MARSPNFAVCTTCDFAIAHSSAITRIVAPVTLRLSGTTSSICVSSSSSELVLGARIGFFASSTSSTFFAACFANLFFGDEELLLALGLNPAVVMSKRSPDFADGSSSSRSASKLSSIRHVFSVTAICSASSSRCCRFGRNSGTAVVAWGPFSSFSSVTVGRNRSRALPKNEIAISYKLPSTSRARSRSRGEALNRSSARMQYACCSKIRWAERATMRTAKKDSYVARVRNRCRSCRSSFSS
mmetsp:Transcript_1279/g.2832  ORF Transcript_1279/g.2832 Transcript_1279/m.2832 type:complete len:242 (+) Transcript_1279:1269-1994(+)